MTTLSYASVKASSTAKENEEKRVDAREKAMLLFAFQLLVDKGYATTASSFASECSLDLSQYVMCENIDLQSIFIEFETYHNIKFQRYPQYFRKSSGSGNRESLLAKLENKAGSRGSRFTSAGNNHRRAQLDRDDNIPPSGHMSAGLASSSMKTLSDEEPFSSCNTNNDKLLKPISGLEFLNEDMRTFAEIIQKEIVVSNIDTKWNDVVGLDNAKMILMESLIYSKQFNDFFGGAFPPWRGLLLYGPPGNGKTLLARAVAHECKTTFFNISSASIVSKWRGDSEKIVKMLFELARYHAPSIIFMDEFDSLGCNRDSVGESDASRRLKSELLQQMDGLLSRNNDHSLPVFILAATNIPWDLDPAVLRRLEKRIYVPLPNANERKETLLFYFTKIMQSIAESSHGKNVFKSDVDFNAAAQATEGYSGSDLHHIAKECFVRKFRQQFPNKTKKLTLETDDVLSTIQTTPPTVTSQLLKKFVDWDAQFGGC